jgi:hypothetical protein
MNLEYIQLEDEAIQLRGLVSLKTKKQICPNINIFTSSNEPSLTY